MIPGQNSNTPATATVENHPSWLTQEMFDGLSKKTISIDTLKPEQQEEFSTFLNKVVSGEATVPAAPAAAASPAPEGGTPAAPAAPAAAAAVPGGLQSPAEVPLADPAKREEFFRKFNEKAAEANTVNQLKNNMREMKVDFERRLAEITARPITPANAEDPLASESVKHQAETVKALNDKLALVMDMMTKQSSALETFHSQAATQVTEQVSLLGLERFQYETLGSDLIPPELSLQTSVPLPMLNAELSKFAERVGGMANVNKYLTDAAYKAQVEGQGVKLSEGFMKNLDKFNLIFDLNEEVKAGKFPDHMAAYSYHLVTNGKLAEALRNAKLAGATAVATGVASNANATPMLQPGADGTPKVPAWTVKSAREWLRTHQEIKPGSADDVTFQEINSLLAQGALR